MEPLNPIIQLSIDPTGEWVIAWKSHINARIGRGTKQFSRIEAEALAQELNDEFPDIEHQAVPLGATEVKWGI